ALGVCGGRPHRRRVDGGPQQRRRRVRRKRHGKPRTGGRPAGAVARPLAQPLADAAAAGGRVLQARRGEPGRGRRGARRGERTRARGAFAGQMTETPPSPSPVVASSAARDVRYVCIHGHFYQPPRENPWLEAIEGQPSAYPYHDWNERISAECYAPNANARILDGDNRIVAIVNNYAS